MQKIRVFAAHPAVLLQIMVAVVLFAVQAIATAVAAPIHTFYRRTWCFYDVAPEDVRAFKELTETVTRKSGELHEVIERARTEVKKLETITGGTNEKLTEASTEAKSAMEAVREFKTRMTDIEQKLAKKPGGESGDEVKSAGQIFVESDAYTTLKKKNFRGESEPVGVGSAHKTALLNTAVGGTNPQPLVVNERVPNIIFANQRRLTIRDLLPQMRTESNLVEYTTETFTNNAGPQFSSPNDRENVLKNESGFSFALSNAAVITLAHFVPVSRQVLSDAKGLQDYINMRLMYGLKLQEETQLLTGDGTGGNLTGLNTGATAYNRDVSNDTAIDTLLRSMLQCTASEFAATGFILHPIDWFNIQLLKDTQGRYIFSDPQSMSRPAMWGLPVVPTNSQTAGTFTTGAFDLCAAIWDREDATVRYSENYSDYFVRNMVALLVEERLTLTIYRALGLIKGTLHATPQAGGN